MAQPTQEFDLESMIAEQGGTIKDVRPDGSAVVEMTDPNTGAIKQLLFDTNAFLKEQGVDPRSVQVKYNSPESALDANPVGFATALKLSLADPKQQIAMLQEEFGPDNVMQTPEGLRVKENGVWKQADPGFLANLVSSTPEIAAGIGGAKGGAALGTAIMPGVGTAIGALIGGAGAAALATVVKNEGAEALNIRTEEDANAALNTFGKELTNNLIWGVALGAGGAALKVGGKVLKRAFDTVADKATLAEAAAKWIPGTSPRDWQTVVRSAKDAKAVMSEMDQVVAWRKAGADSVTSGIDPATRKMVHRVRVDMEKFKQAAYRQYDDVIKTLEASGAAERAKIPAGSAAVEFKKDLIGLGLIETAEDGTMRVAANPANAEAGRIIQVFDPKSVRTLNKVFQQLNSVIPEGGNLTFKQAKELMRGIDDILESSGHFNGGDMAISNNARVALSRLRKNLSQSVSNGLQNETVTHKGVSKNAAKFYREGMSSYHQFREVYDDFALPSRLGGDSRQVSATVERMLGDRGFALEENYSKLAAAVGKRAEPSIARLQQLRAAKNLSTAYDTTSTGIGSIGKNIMFGGPRATAQTLADWTIRLNRQRQRLSPASSQAKTLIESRARGIDFVSKLDNVRKMELISNPVALRQFVLAIEGAPQEQDRVSQELMSQAQ